MLKYQCILLAGFTCLLFFKDTRFAASVFLTGWAVYLTTTIGASANTYYIASAIIETTIAITLNRKHKYVSYLGYSLIFVNIFGFTYHSDMDGRTYYTLIYAAVSITQIILLLCRLIPDGIRRLFKQCGFVCNHYYDGDQTCAKVSQTTQTLED